MDRYIKITFTCGEIHQNYIHLWRNITITFTCGEIHYLGKESLSHGYWRKWRLGNILGVFSVSLLMTRAKLLQYMILFPQVLSNRLYFDIWGDCYFLFLVKTFLEPQQTWSSNMGDFWTIFGLCGSCQIWIIVYSEGILAVLEATVTDISRYFLGISKAPGLVIQRGFWGKCWRSWNLQSRCCQLPRF